MLDRYQDKISTAPAKLAHVKTVIKADVAAAKYYLPQRQRLNLAGLSFEDKVFKGAYLANTNLAGTRMIRVIWDGAIVGPAQVNAKTKIVTGTTMSTQHIGTCVFLNCRASGDGIALKFERLLPAIDIRLKHDPIYCHLSQRTHFLYKLQSIAKPLADGRIEINFERLDQITAADYPVVIGNKQATEKLHRQCKQLVGYFRKVQAEYQTAEADSKAEQQATETLFEMHAALSAWDSVETNIKKVSAKYSISDALALIGESLGRTQDNLSYFTLPWAIETLSDMLTDAADVYDELGSIGLIMIVGMATNALLTRLGYRHAGAIGMMAGVITTGMLMLTSTFSPGLAAMAALFSLAMVVSRQGLGAIIKGVMLNQAFHYATDHAAFIISTTPAAQDLVERYAIPRALQISMTGFYAVKLYQGQKVLERLPDLTERQTIEQAKLPLILQQLIQASLMAKYLGFACGVDIVQQLRGAVSWLVFRIPGLNWQIEVPQNELQKLLANFKEQTACLEAAKTCQVYEQFSGPAVIEYGQPMAMDPAICKIQPLGYMETLTVHQSGAWTLHQGEQGRTVSVQKFGSNHLAWTIDGGDFPGSMPDDMCTPGAVEAFQAGLEKLSATPINAEMLGAEHGRCTAMLGKLSASWDDVMGNPSQYPTGQFASASAFNVLAWAGNTHRNTTTSAADHVPDTGWLPNSAVFSSHADVRAASSIYAQVKTALGQSYLSINWLVGGTLSMASRVVCCRRKKAPAKVSAKEFNRAAAFIRPRHHTRPPSTLAMPATD